MPINEMKQQMSFAYLKMVATTAGVDVLSWASDYEGVDATLSSGAHFASRIGIKLDVQLKCTSSPKYVGNSLVHQLSRRRYEKLRHEKRYDVAMLAVLVLPPTYSSWLDQDEDRLLSRSCMYYSLTSDWSLIGSKTESKLVHLPKRNVLDPDALNRAMETAASKDVFSW